MTKMKHKLIRLRLTAIVYRSLGGVSTLDFGQTTHGQWYSNLAFTSTSCVSRDAETNEN